MGWCWPEKPVMLTTLNAAHQKSGHRLKASYVCEQHKACFLWASGPSAKQEKAWLGSENSWAPLYCVLDSAPWSAPWTRVHYIPSNLVCPAPERQFVNTSLKSHQRADESWWINYLNKLLTVMFFLSALWCRDATTEPHWICTPLVFLIILLQMQSLFSSDNSHHWVFKEHLIK